MSRFTKSEQLEFRINDTVAIGNPARILDAAIGHPTVQRLHSRRREDTTSIRYFARYNIDTRARYSACIRTTYRYRTVVDR